MERDSRPPKPWTSTLTQPTWLWRRPVRREASPASVLRFRRMRSPAPIGFLAWDGAAGWQPKSVSPCVPIGKSFIGEALGKAIIPRHERGGDAIVMARL